MERVKGIEPSFLVGVFAFPKGDRSPKCILRHLFAVVLVSPPLEPVCIIGIYMGVTGA
jgi:hypothetical protein